MSINLKRALTLTLTLTLVSDSRVLPLISFSQNLSALTLVSLPVPITRTVSLSRSHSPKTLSAHSRLTHRRASAFRAAPHSALSDLVSSLLRRALALLRAAPFFFGASSSSWPLSQYRRPPLPATDDVKTSVSPSPKITMAEERPWRRLNERPWRSRDHSPLDTAAASVATKRWCAVRRTPSPLYVIFVWSIFFSRAYN